MTRKLLNKRNLIIIMICLVLFNIPNVSFADTISISEVLKETIAGWFYVIKYVCIAIMLVTLILVGIQGLLSKKTAKFKEMLAGWIISILLLFFIEYIIYLPIYFNEQIIVQCKELGETLAGLDEYDSEEYEEVTLYDSAISKAYEIKFSSGMLGMIMYIVLLYYTVKFFFVYLKRYVNVMVLILISPVVITVDSFKKLFQGKGTTFGRWAKELLYNVFIQSFHALAYSTLIGLTIKLGDTAEGYIGAFLTLIIFAFIFKLDKIIRKLFNFVGGSSIVQSRDYMSTAKKTYNDIKDMKDRIAGGFGNGLTEGETATVSSVKYKSKVSGKFTTMMPSKTSEAYIGVPEQEEVKPKRFKIVEKIKSSTSNVKPNKKKEKEQLEQEQKDGTIKRLGKILKGYKKRSSIVLKATDKDSKLSLDDKMIATVIDFGKSEEEEAKKIIKELKSDNYDIISIIYAIQGLGVFIYSEVGSPYMGMSVLASSRYESETSRTNEINEAGEAIGIANKINYTQSDLKIKTKSKRRYNIKGVLRLKGRKYKFNRFSSSSIRTISRVLNKKYIASDEYLRTISAVGTRVIEGNISIAGAYRKVGTTNARNINIKYKSKVKSKAYETQELNAQFVKGVQGEIKNETDVTSQKPKEKRSKPVRELKLAANQKVSVYHERKQEAEWAVMGAISSDIVEAQGQIVHMSRQATRITSSGEIALENLTNVGQAFRINSNKYVVFDMDITQPAGEIGTSQIYGFTDSDTSYEDKFIVNMFKSMSETEKKERMTSMAIIDIAEKYDIPLEKLDMTNREVQDELIDALIRRGLLESSVRSDTRKRQEIVASVMERRDNLITNDKEEYKEIVVRRELVKAVAFNHEKVTFGNEDSKKSEIPEKIEEFVQGQGTYSVLLRSVVSKSVKTDAESIRHQLIKQAEKIVENIGTETVSEETDSTDEGSTLRVERTVGATKNNTDENKYSTETIFKVYIYGEVVQEGQYELQIGSKIRDLILKAGGPTEKADLTKINIDEALFDGEEITIPTIADDDLEKIFEKCRPIIEEIMTEYMKKHKITDPEILRRKIYKKEVIRKIKKRLEKLVISETQADQLLKDKKLTTKTLTDKQIEELLEEEIKRKIKMKQMLTETKDSMRVINSDRIKDSESGVSDSNPETDEDTDIDLLNAALQEFNNMSRNVETSETSEQVALETNEEMNRLLEQLIEQREAVYVNSSNSQTSEARKAVLDMFDANLNGILRRM